MWIFFLIYINLEISSNVLKEINKVNLTDLLFECYFTEVIPPNNFDNFDNFRDPPMSSFSNQIQVVPLLNPS